MAAQTRLNFMKTDFPFHHVYMEQVRAEQRAETIRSWLLAALVVGMFFAGCVVGWCVK